MARNASGLERDNRALLADGLYYRQAQENEYFFFLLGHPRLIVVVGA